MFLSKSLLRVTLPALLACAGIATASPLVTLSENAALYFSGFATLESDSNVLYSNEDEQDDLVYTIAPGFELVGGVPGSATEFELSAGYAIRRYSDLDQLDTELPSIEGKATFKSAKSTTTVNAGYVESRIDNRRSAGSGTDPRQAILSAGISSDVRMTGKTAVVGGVSYRDTDRKVFGTDYTDVSIPVNVYYTATEKLDVGLGYRYSDTSVDDGALGDRTNQFLNVALRGELSPKVVADIKVGIIYSDFDNADGEEGFGLDASIDYIPNDKVTSSFTLSRDITVGFSGEVIDATMVAADLSYMFDEQFSGGLTLAMGNDEYQDNDRDEDWTQLSLGLSYSPIGYLNVNAAYNFLDNDSNIDFATFSKNTFSLSINVRY